MNELTERARVVHTNFLANFPLHMIKATKSYPKPLPADLEPWYLYTQDGGHSIIAGVRTAYEQHKHDNDLTRAENCLVPMPVKTVLRGYTMSEEGYPLVEVEYDSTFGLIPPAGDDEF